MSADWTYQGEKIDAIPDQYEGFVYPIYEYPTIKSTLEKTAKSQNNKAHQRKKKQKTRTQRKRLENILGKSDLLPRRCPNLEKTIPCGIVHFP